MLDKEEARNFCNGSNTEIIGATLKTPLGDYSIKACGRGVHSLIRVKDEGKKFNPDLQVNILESNPIEEAKSSSESQAMMSKITKWFHCYFSDPMMLQKNFPESIEFCVPNATPFQQEVWKALQTVEFGSSVSYGELATIINKPKAARAVGSAMKNNPNCIIVPCHRVIRANSDIGNYNGGVEIKEWLLNHEKNNSGK